MKSALLRKRATVSESDLGTWKIMIVDDDDFVHRVTRF